MLTAVLITNGLLALLCLFVAWKVWQLRQALSQAADALIMAERNTHNVLHGAPEAILQGQMGTRQLRQSYQQLERQMQMARQALAILSLGQSLLGRRWGRRSRPPSLKSRPLR